MKRLLDLSIVLPALVLFSPVLLLLMIWAFIEFGSAFFSQPRIGKNGSTFRMFKIRTMKDPVDPLVGKLNDIDRLTRISRLVRSYHLDELPQFLNVLKGEMSLVGPRPLLVNYQNLISIREQKRHLVNPGITGLAQIRGANSLTWNQRFELDLHYIENSNLLFDCKILMMTLLRGLKPDPASSVYLSQVRQTAMT